MWPRVAPFWYSTISFAQGDSDVIFFTPYLCRLRFSAMMWDKLCEMFFFLRRHFLSKMVIMRTFFLNTHNFYWPKMVVQSIEGTAWHNMTIVNTVTADYTHLQPLDIIWLIQFYSNNAANLHHLNPHRTPCCPQHRDRNVTRDYCVVTSTHLVLQLMRR